MKRRTTRRSVRPHQHPITVIISLPEGVEQIATIIYLDRNRVQRIWNPHNLVIPPDHVIHIGVQRVDRNDG